MPCLARPRAAAAAALALACVVSACATRSIDVKPLAADPATFARLDCTALDDEADRVRQRAAQVAYTVDERFGTNMVALGIGISGVFWPALLAMRPAGPDAVELASLKGREEALRAVQQDKRCPPPAEFLSPERAAALPVALGERLVYEERAARGGAARVLGLRLRALRRGELEFAVEPADPQAEPRWVQDRAGNVPNVDGYVHWRRLLQPPMALGSVLAGDLIGPDGNARGRVRGQVIALGVQNGLGRPFDAAVIELFGDVPLAQGELTTRLDGVMVVDRKSGVLLRLELRSGNPDFALRRTLMRVEAAKAPG